jgi:hypothetical protein
MEAEMSQSPSTAAPSKRRPLWQRAAALGVVLTGTLVAGVGVLHMPFAKKFLMKAGGCPFAVEATPEQRDRAHQAALRSSRGTEAAPAKPALGFHLDATTRADVVAWASDHHLACQKDRGDVLRCNDVPAAAMGVPAAEGPATILSFSFDARSVLVDISSMRMHLRPDAALAAVTAMTGNLAEQVGAPHSHVGAFDLEHLSRKGVLGLSNIGYRFRDYAVDVVTMSFDTDGLVLREHYASIADGS